MFEKRKPRLGIAPIAWTNDDMPELGGGNTFAQCISEMALAGYEGSELGNKYPRDPALLSKALRLRNLRICNAWFSTFFTDGSDPEATFTAFIAQRDFLHAMGAELVGVCEQGGSVQGRRDIPVFGGKPRFSDAQWKSLCAGLERLGKLAAEKGMRIAFHHHMGTGVQTGDEIDRLMEGTDPGLVGLLFDSGHLAFSGEEPLAVLRKHLSRVRHVHLKDIRSRTLERARLENMSFLDAVRAGVFTVPGDGMIDFMPIFIELDAAGYGGWMVVEAEQDPALADPLEYAMKARKYIREKTGL
jgi:inosose dehydratase